MPSSMGHVTLEPLVLPPLEAGPHVFLSGPMAVGKSTVLPLVAARLGQPFVDLDREIEARAGTSVAELFHTRGEAAFRALETEVVAAVAARTQPTVIALGGGTVTSEPARRVVSSRGVVVTLVAEPSVLARRAGDARPLLRGATSESERAARLGELCLARAAAYAEANVELDVGTDAPDVVADAIVAELREAPIVVPLAERAYRIRIGEGELDRVGARVTGLGVRGRVLVATDENARAYADRVAAALAAADLEPHVHALAPGEEHKTVRSLEALWDAALGHGVDRKGAIVAVGGGVALDVAGLAAATLLRGVRWVAVPTTLLSMVDAAVGGKTAIDRPQGKNLVGALHQPSLVVVDPSVLATLPDRAFVAGLAEVVKCAWIAGEAALARLEADAGALVAREPVALRAALELALRVKARIVAHDERETHARLALNLGHTIGHALEAASGYTLPHGEAVALGLRAAHRVARALGAGGATDEARTVALLGRLGLPTDLSAAGLGGTGLERFVASDKKASAGHVRFVVPRAPGALALALMRPADAVAAARG